jgi:acyl-CoA thioester hydrolase
MDDHTTELTSATDVLRAAPYISPPRAIQKDWIDYNGHLNMAYYNVLFDTSVGEIYAALGIGRSYFKERNFSTFTAEVHIRYLRELRLEDPVQVSVLFVAVDDKRMHTYKELIHAKEKWVAATSENMTLHVDMATRKVAPFPPDILPRMHELVKTHQSVPRDPAIGRRIAMPSG